MAEVRWQIALAASHRRYGVPPDAAYVKLQAQSAICYPVTQ